MLQLSYPHMTPGKTIALTIQIFVSKEMSLLFNILSRFIIAFLPRSKCVLILWLHSPSTVILERPPPQIKSAPASNFSPFVYHEVMEADVMILTFWMLSSKPVFSLFPFALFKVSLVPLHFLPLEWYHLQTWGCLYFSCQSWFQPVIHPAWNCAWCTSHKN